MSDQKISHDSEGEEKPNGLGEDGICGQATYDMLMNEDAKVYVMQLGDSGPDVEGVQQRLYELGRIICSPYF